MENSPPVAEFKQVFKLSLSIFLLLAMLLTAITLPLIYSFEKNRKEVIIERESGYLEAAKQLFHTNLFEAYANIEILANLPALDSFTKSHNNQDKIKVEQHFSVFVEEFKHYDQVRFIDNLGQEKIRVNYSDNKAIVSPSDILQNKAGRYYFHAVRSLSRGERYISPLDLNIENGQVEIPYKPMIRFATSVFEKEGNRKGIIITNYNSGKLLHAFRTLMKKSDMSQSMLLNNEGYWLNGTQPEKDWGFMFGKKEDNFAFQKPELWRVISTESDGQIETNEGLYLFTTFYPMSLNNEYVDQKITPNSPPRNDNAYSWKIVHLIPKNALYNTSLLNSTWGLSWTLASYFVLALLSWLAASFRIHSQLHTRQLLTKDKHLSKINRRNILATDSANIGIWEFDIQSGKLFWDDWMHRIYGTVPENFHESFQDWENAVHPDDKTVTLDALKESIDQKKPFHYQFRIRQPSGEIRWIKADAITEYDENGSATHVIGANRDITQKINDEININKALKDLNEAQRLAHIGSWTLDRQTDQLEWSDEIYRLIEVQKEKFKPSYEFFLKLIHPDDREDAHRAYLKSIIDHTSYDIEHRLLFADGRIKYVHERCQTIYGENGVPLQNQGTLQDITERKLAEQKSAQLLKIIEESPDFIGSADLQGNLLYHNSSANRLLGLDKNSDVSHLNIKDMHPDWANRKIFEEGFPILETQGYWYGETALLHRDGHEIPVLQTIMLHRDEKGKPALLSTIIRDITEAKRIEAELRNATQIAEKASQAKSLFLANMSHEIRTPIHATMGLLTLLSDTVLNQKQRKYLQQAQSSINILLNLLNDILDFSKIESGKLELENRPVLLTKLLSQIQSTMRTQAKQKGIALKINPSNDLPEWVMGDHTCLMQVLINLISNAIKFTFEGQVVFSIRAMPAEDQWRITFEVSDTGIGISNTKINQIFEPFIQLENINERKFDGTGLGLAISKHIIETMGGELHVESQPGKGSRFFFTLVMQKVAPDSLIVETQKDIDLNLNQGNALQGKRILLAEDNPALQAMTQLYLEQQGAIITLVDNGLEAVSMIACQPSFDIVLMDIQMPIMDGHEAARNIRKHHSIEQLPIIAMTASALKKDRDDAFAAGMNNYIVKPFDLVRLVEVLLDFLPRDSSDEPGIMNTSKSAITKHAAVELQDTEGFDLQNALSRMNDMPMIYIKVAKQFIIEYPTLRNQFHQLLADKDFSQAARMAHRLKGSTSQLGAVSFTNFLNDAENRVKSGLGANETASLQSQFDQQFEQAISSLKFILTTLENNT